MPAFLGDPRGVDAALRDLEAGAARYNGFNLLAGDRLKASWMSNRVPGIHRLVHGVHGVSNARLDTPWPKLTRVKAGVAAWSRAGSEDIGALFDLLGDRALAPEAELPSTGVPPDWERVLSAPFIVSGRYGTRCSTVVTIDAESRLRFLERSFDADGRFVGEVDESFSVATATA